jgi:hypothetical protein
MEDSGQLHMLSSSLGKALSVSTEDWVGPRANLDIVAKIRNSEAPGGNQTLTPQPIISYLNE